MGKKPYEWDRLNAQLKTLTASQQVLPLLKAERKGKNRTAFVNRLIARYQRLRNTEERKKLENAT